MKRDWSIKKLYGLQLKVEVKYFDNKVLIKE
jgi:hypothetical protein